MILHKGNSDKRFKDFLDEIEFEKIILKECLAYSQSKTDSVNFGEIKTSRIFHFDYLTFQIKPNKGDYVKINKIIQDMILNGFERGEQPVFIKLYEGKRGYILRVRDSGKGFDLEKKLEQMKNGEEYFQRFGDGLESFEKDENIIFYQGKNNIVNLVYLKK